MSPATSANGADQMASLVAQMEADRNLLAQRILGKFSSSSIGSGNTSDEKNAGGHTAPQKRDQPKQRKLRPANLGVGAQIPASDSGVGTSSAGSLLQDVRLKGRLTSKRKRSGDELLAADGRRKFDPLDGKGGTRTEVEEDDDDDDVSRSKAADANEAASKRLKLKSKDVFATAAAKASKQSDPASAAKKPCLNGTTAEADSTEKNNGASPLFDGPDLSAFSKSQRKKLRRKMQAKQAAEVAQSNEHDTDLSDRQSLGTAATTPHYQAHLGMPEDIATSSLTPLQTSMSASLSGARFRSINEKLYTSDSRAALQMMLKNPEMMREYHDGFASQTHKWPVNPVVQIAGRLRAITHGQPGAKDKRSAGGKLYEQARTSSSVAAPILVVDLGAGTAPLAKAMQETPQVTVLSYDLLDSPDGWVTGCDIGTRVPLPGRPGVLLARVERILADAQSGWKGDKNAHAKLLAQEMHRGPEVADVAVFSLSLMGTNWVDMIIEARRILKTNARLIIAEVTSRITDRDAFVAIIEALGFKCDTHDTRSSYFWLFEFCKAETVPEEYSNLSKSERNERIKKQMEEEKQLVTEGASVLKACLYKKR
ncbi:hypothetical protein K437DRAFT_261112 [Tilletiaria anomala UBC 951]|uniref:Ribosomal RNA-processing protein 8 n=1 Tax=Tilletiaria anomala (strain ATCC 24038 / CBS 436.72 / UBC 951) TaxID=1037660 RepID=A0A066WFB6_TILAU|nr:uncharacterized protein K437DRAFT_261112 [Tilletiaria anomala UBC 951]KDN52672.1 hypothetical protein K437DRAFT_261112 [Tilletiaria anomala UBC 951]